MFFFNYDIFSSLKNASIFIILQIPETSEIFPASKASKRHYVSIKYLLS